MTRFLKLRFALALAFPLVATLAAGAVRAQDPTPADDPIAWRDAHSLTVEGQGWTDVKSPFDRLPAKAEGVVRPPVWSNSRHSAGIAVRFVTDSPEIHARWTLTNARLAMNHMPATGVSGLDLYARDDDGQWRWVAVGIPDAQENTKALAKGIKEGRREYMLYLPLYNGVKSVEIGVPKDRELAPGDPRKGGRERPIVFYGTSITHGGCASRPGMAYPAIIGRRLDVPTINLGYSGSGTMDQSMSDLLVELDAAAYVIDCLPNMKPDQVTERTEPLVQTIRKVRPDTPIVLVEDRYYTNGYFLEGNRRHNEANHAALRAAYERLTAAGVKNLHYLEGAPQLGDDGEATVDGSHPTDLGFMRQADFFAPALSTLIAEPINAVPVQP